MNEIITPIFATPIYSSKINRNLKKEELNFINKSKVYLNQGNTTSENNFVLENKIFLNIKKEILKHIDNYFLKIISSNKKIKPYITQSWLNFTEKNQFHHKHNHSNSIVSGVFYISADKNYDKIHFYKNQYQQIEIEPKEYNLYNSQSWWFSIESGDIILFPSHITHSVETKKENNIRISLAFNVFIKGEIGDLKGLTKLIL